jgi:hypothetical protein
MRLVIVSFMCSIPDQSDDDDNDQQQKKSSSHRAGYEKDDDFGMPSNKHDDEFAPDPER